MAWNAVRMKEVPIWAFHGVDDSVVAVTESIHMAGALRACGGKVKLTLIPETNHNAWEPALRDFQVVQWMMMHRLSDRA